MKVAIIDNYDSFTFNLYQIMGELLEKHFQQDRTKSNSIQNESSFLLKVFRNDELRYDQFLETKWDRVVISPGPGHPGLPEYFGICSEILTDLGKTVPVLGICLGMQGIAHYYQGQVIPAPLPMHGKVSRIQHDGRGVFRGLDNQVEVMRYHSLVVEEKSLPAHLTVSARVPDTGELMGIRHFEYPIEGIQFHPESFATVSGREMLQNFLFH